MTAHSQHHLHVHLPQVRRPQLRWPGLPRTRRPGLLGELGLAALLLAAYLGVDTIRGAGRAAAARSHGEHVLRLEQWLHIDIEHGLNAWLATHPGLMTAANYEYATTYVISAILLLVGTYLWSPRLYRQARNSFIVLNLLAFACFALLPMTPPRMLPGFIDTVATGRTVGSWGSPMVADANQLAAMPSLHMAWALWVSVMLARTSRRRWLQVLSAVHVLVTLYVVLATANHYVLDVLGAAVVVAAAVVATERWDAHHPGERMPTSDAFFLDVETDDSTQNVGGLALLAGDASYEEIRANLDEQLDVLPHFTDRLVSEETPRWLPAGPIDWSHHLVELTVPDGGDLESVVGALTAQRLPRDRPLWRVWLIRGLGDRVAFCIVMHHCIADGVGAVAKLLHLLQPSYELPIPDRAGPGPLRRAGGVIQGLAQLATDGRPAALLPAGGPERGFATAQVPLAAVQQAARSHRMRVTELLLAAAGTALAEVDPALADACGNRLRVSVPVMLRSPHEVSPPLRSSEYFAGTPMRKRRSPGADEDGNLTGAVIVDAPALDAPIDEVRDEVRRATAALRTPTRALASRWVMATALRAVPHAGRRWFGRTVYGRKYFQAILSNMPGPDRPFTMAGYPLDEVYPILPPAPGIPLTIGALSWNGVLGFTVVTDANTLDARTFLDVLQDKVQQLRGVPDDAEPVLG
ncbi:bifunctional phosphatase PAP2/O-acyltransferase family protein [Flexivirga caeni]|uniref:DUF1298 domain-containing protein n=1 Tax=Flexivirga caeni TaxID=2294115 RepID=A0A3M9M218_9MICO|nr:phosphatase PAP2 family protein [Flexivirga caeni]RNI19631.1 DUF1298 domain-containing protein [Flexivirga caeni]